MTESVGAGHRAPEPGLDEGQEVGMAGTPQQDQLGTERPDTRQCLQQRQGLRVRQRPEVGAVQITRQGSVGALIAAACC